MEQQSLKPLNILCWLCVCLFSTYEMMARVTLGVFQSPIMNDLQINSSQFALLSTTAFSLTAGILQIPVGFFFSRYKFRNVLLCSAAIGVVGNAGLMMSDHFYSCMFFRVFSAVGAAVGYLAAVFSVFILLPKKNHGLFIGLTSFITCLGAAFSEGPMAKIFHYFHLSWHHVFLLFSVVNALLFLSAFLFSSLQRTAYSKSQESKGVQQNDWTLIRNILLISVCYMFTVEYLCQNHGHLLLVSKNMDEVTAAYVLSLIWLGYAFCAPIIGYLSDKEYGFYSVLFFFSAGFFVSLLAIVYSDGSLQYNALCVLMFGIFSSGQCMVYTLVPKITPPQYCAVLLGAIGTMNHVFIALFSPVLSYWVDRYSLTPSLFDYQSALIPLFFFAGLPFLISLYYSRKKVLKSLIYPVRLARSL